MEQYRFKCLFLVVVKCLTILQVSGTVTKDELLTHVHSLEKSVLDLQSQFQVQEQANARILTQLLSKLATTTDELQELRGNYTALESELDMVKRAYEIKDQAQETEITELKGNITSLNQEVLDLTTRVGSLQTYGQSQAIYDKHQEKLLKLLQDSLNTAQGNLTELQASMATLEVGLDSLNDTQKIQSEEQHQLYQQALSELNNTEGQVSRLNNEYNSLKTDLDHLKTNFSSAENDIKTLIQKDMLNEIELANLKLDVAKLSLKLDKVWDQAMTNAGLNSSMNDLETHIKKLESNMTSTWTAQQSEILALQSDNNAVKVFMKDMDTANVAYQSSLNSIGTISYGMGDIIIFSDPLYNRGDAFNKTSGQFVAPVAGTYMFWANVAFINGNSVLIMMQKNGRYFGSVYGTRDPNANVGTGSGIAAVHLDTGDVVTFSSSSPVYLQGGLSWAGGALLHRDV